MSTAFMLAIATMYFCAAAAFAWEGKALWTALCCSWGIGNAIIPYLSK